MYSIFCADILDADEDEEEEGQFLWLIRLNGIINSCITFSIAELHEKNE